MNDYKFTNTWFQGAAQNVWEMLVPQIRPSKILEVGSYEGASVCYLINTLANDADLEIHCVDTWSGGIEHQEGGEHEADMGSVESRFDHNVALAISGVQKTVEITKHKKFSDVALSRMIAEDKKNYFDFVYIDGSHQASDVLCDAVLGFRLLKVGGYMVFDDYIWAENLPGGKDISRCPKSAIDAFVNINFKKIDMLMAPLYQLYIRKTSD